VTVETSSLLARVLLLGPIEILVAGDAVDLSGKYQRALVAILASAPGKLIPAERLIDGLWGEQPPTSARTKLQGHVSALRNKFGGGNGWPIQTCDPGYLLSEQGVSTDLADYRELREQAGKAVSTGHYAQASDRLADALGLWRGPAYAGASSSFVLAAMSDALEQDRLLAIERKAICDLHLRRYDEVIASLTLALASHPLRDGMRGMLMLAQYRDGCRAEALQAYLQGYRLSREHVGIDPCRELQALHRLILCDDPVLMTPDAMTMLPGAASSLLTGTCGGTT
jgi:DNA-binding SARP family transcriptional activator